MRHVVSFAVLTGLVLGPGSPAQKLELPLEPKSVRFGVIGDSGTGEKAQYEVAQQMNQYRAAFPFDFVIMLGDNMYGGESPKDFRRKFEEPYQPLLEAGVQFFAALGNHDNPNECYYKLFNMGGERFYKFEKAKVAFFVLDSNYMDPKQLDWLQKQLNNSKAQWKICYFHHPLYSDGKFHGPDVDLRALLEPLFQNYGVNVVFTGHEHIYERFKPQNGIHYFVLGNSAELRAGNIRASAKMAKGFDTDRTFMLVEVAGDRMYFQAISRKGETVDSGVIERPPKAPPVTRSEKGSAAAPAATAASTQR